MSTGKKVPKHTHNLWQPWTVGALAVAAFAALLTHIVRSFFAPEYAERLLCDANGQIQEGTKGLHLYWQISSYFSTNIPVLRRLPYTQAKVIDASWDLVFGRGGQVLAGIIAYCVVRDTIKLNMERSALPIPTATLVLLQQQIQFATVSELFRAFFSRLEIKCVQRKGRKIETRPRIFACLFVCSYVLAFATITSVMTGYFAEVEGFYISLTNNEPMTSVTKFTRAFLLLVDSERIDYTAGSTVGIGDIDDLELKIFFDERRGDGVYDDPFRKVIYEYWNSCTTLPGPVLHEQGLDWSWDTSAHDGGRIFTNPYMPSNNSWSCKSGNCSCYLPPGSISLNDIRSNITIGSETFSLDAPPLNISRRNFIDQNLHHAEYESWNGARWIDDFWVQNGTGVLLGFSGQVLLTFITYTFLFAVALVWLRCEVWCRGRWYRIGQSYSIYSDVLAIASSLEAVCGPEIDTIPLKLFKKKVSKHRGGLCLQRDGVPLPEQVKQQQETLIQAAETRGSNTRKELEALVAEYNIRLLGSESENSTMQDEEAPSINVDAQGSPVADLETRNEYALALLPKPSEDKIAQHLPATDFETSDEQALALLPWRSEDDIDQDQPAFLENPLEDSLTPPPRSSVDESISTQSHNNSNDSNMPLRPTGGLTPARQNTQD